MDRSPPLKASSLDNEINRRRIISRRKQTILSLLDELAAIHDEDYDHEPTLDPAVPSFSSTKWRNQTMDEEDEDEEEADRKDRPLKEGARIYLQFEARIGEVDAQFFGFINAVRPLASSVGLISFTQRLRARFQEILRLFRSNAITLYPKHVPPDLTLGPSSSNLELFPTQLQLLASDLSLFLNYLQAIPEFIPDFIDGSLFASALRFQADLKYWSVGLAHLQQQMNQTALRRYINNMTEDMGQHLDDMWGQTDSCTKGVSARIRNAQEHGQAALQNLSTVATFFSAVAATTIQYSFDQVETRLQQSVNALWFSSLVFSIASAINSQVAYHWRVATYRSPPAEVPWLANLCLLHLPLIFLIISVVAFSAGLICYTYSSGQGHIVSLSTTLFTSITSLTLFVASAWFAAERLVFARTKGRQWLAAYIQEQAEDLVYATGMRWLAGAIIRYVGRVAIWNATPATRSVRGTRTPAYEENPAESSGIMLATERPPALAGSSSPGVKAAASGPARFRRAGQKVIELNRMAHRSDRPTTSKPASRQMSKSSTTTARRAHPIPATIKALKKMVVEQRIGGQSGAVTDMRFSPDGRWLAACSQDRTTVIWKVGEPFAVHQVLLHPGAGPPEQLVWSPDSRHLLTRTLRTIKAWLPESGLKITTVGRPNEISAVKWAPTGTCFACVEDDEVLIMDMEGDVTETHQFDRAHVHDVAFSPDEKRLFLITTLEKLEDGLTPAGSRPMGMIVVYNRLTMTVESRAPIVGNVRGIDVARSGLFGVISYRGHTPPDGWRIVCGPISTGTADNQEQGSLVQTYMPAGPVDYACASFIGGIHDEFVVTAGKRGEIHIWDCESGRLLHSMHNAHGLGKRPATRDLTAVAWNDGISERYMMAVGSADGQVVVWTASTPAGPQILPHAIEEPVQRAESPENMTREEEENE